MTQNDRRNSLINIIKYYASPIVNKKLDPYIGFDKIDKIIRTTEFDYPAFSLDNCYADYISIWEVAGDGLQLHTGSGLTKEQYIDKTKGELINELKNWMTKIEAV